MEKISKANDGAIGEEGNCWNNASMDYPHGPIHAWDIHLHLPLKKNIHVGKYTCMDKV